MKIRGNKIIFKALVGSHAYGTNVEGSDLDYKGVYIQRPKDVLEHGYCPQIDVNKDEVYFEVGRFLELCATGNPTMLELLYTPLDCVIYTDPLWLPIWHSKDSFLTKACRHSFGGYAISQIKKAGGLDKKMNWEKDRVVRKSVEDFCYMMPFHQEMHYRSAAQTLASYLKEYDYEAQDCGLVKIEHMRDCYLLFCDDSRWVHSANHRFKDVMKSFEFKGIATEDANDVCLSEVPAYVTPRGILFFNRDAYSIHCREYGQYTSWLANRNTQRYVDVDEHGQKIDGKNLLHCVRLIETGLDVAREKAIVVRRPNAQYLIEIRKGKHDLKTLLDKCEKDLEEMDAAFAASGLPDKVSDELVKKLTKEIREEYYKQDHES